MVLMLLVRHFLDGKPVGFRARYEPRVQSSVVQRKELSYYLNLNANKQVSGNENVHHRHTYGRIPISHPA